MNIQYISIYKSKKLKTTQWPSIGEWINKLAYPHNGLLFSNKKELITMETCYNMDEFWKLYAR